jgi:guanylate kinase
MDALFITKLLSTKHRNDLWDTEVEVYSPSTGLNHRLDFWAMSSNKNIDMTAYEIKVDRQDFLHDKKWHSYKEFCNRMYFICPKDVIKKEEIPGGIGLIYAYGSGYLKVIKPAIHREQEAPSRFLHKMMTKHIEVFKQVHNYELKRNLSVEEFMTKNSSNSTLGKYFKDKLIDENERLKYQNESLREKVKDWHSVMSRYNPYTVEEAMSRTSSEFDLKSLASRVDTIKLMIDTYMKQDNKSKKVYLIVSPSASGKTTIVNNALNNVNDLERVKTTTTRKIRPDETSDDYDFIDAKRFLTLIDQNYFAEYAMVYGNYYGTPVKEIVNNTNKKILIIDIQGAKHLKETYGDKVVSVFFLPPGINTVMDRLKKRENADDIDIQNRINAYQEELEYAKECDHTIEFDAVDVMTSYLLGIINDYK